ncbi:MAG: tol-pal system protein YbgF [Alphaproteobacteria bacterium]|nr:tol-pal system protein YbgF [Alphaproteobacteria bacterium]
MRALALALLLISIAPATQAQDMASMADRMARLERDLTFMQRQIYQGGAKADPAAAPATQAQAHVQFTQLQEEMRQLRGQFEQVQYMNARLQTELKQLSDDMDFRLQAIEKQLAEQQAASEDVEDEDVAEEEEEAEEEPARPEDNPAQYEPNARNDNDNDTSSSPRTFENASAHYSYAFKLMNDRKFAEASKSFDSFVDKYPKDPLTANAYYWLGESYYVRSQYAKAAEGFRNGFEAAPKGSKAPDNLLKLAMSLGGLKRNDQACVVLKQIISKYGNRAPDARTKAQREYGKLKCK